MNRLMADFRVCLLYLEDVAGGGAPLTLSASRVTR